MTRLSLVALLAPAALAAAVASARAAPASAPRHVLEVALDPGGELRVQDTLTLPWRRRVELRVSDDLEVAATCGGAPARVAPASPSRPGRRAVTLSPSCRGENDLATVVVTLAGPLARRAADGSRIPLLGRDGAALASDAGWFADTGEPAHFEIVVTAPEDWRVVTSAAPVAGNETAGSGGSPRRFATAEPLDGLALSAGPFGLNAIDSSLPSLVLENVRQDGDAVAGEVVASGLVSPVAVDVVATRAAGGTASARVLASGERTPFRIDDAPAATEVALDPELRVPRRAEPRHLPACLGRTLAHRPLLVVYPDPPRADAGPGQLVLHDRIAALAARLAAPDGRAMAASVAATAEIDAASVLLLGSAAENKRVRELVPDLAAIGVDVSQPGSVRAGARRWRDPGLALLASVPHPRRPGATITAWVPNGPSALDTAEAMLSRAWDGWAVLDGGRVKAQGTPWPDAPWRVELEPAERPAAARVMDTVRALAAPELEGRASGTAGVRGALDRIAAELRAAGARPAGSAGLESPFTFTTVDLAGNPVLWWPSASGAANTVPVLPATSWLPRPTPDEVARLAGSADAIRRVPVLVPLERGLVVAGGPAPRFAGLDLADAAVVVRDDRSPGAVERIEGWIREARLRNARALIVVRADDEWPGEPALVIAGASPSPDRAARVASLRESGGPRAVDRAMAAERAKEPGLGEGASFPLFFAGSRLDALLKELGATRPGARVLAGAQLDLRLSVRVEHLRDSNVVARVGGHSPDGSAVLLSAHHDGRGELPDGSFCPGATDDAGGVAVVLEVARRLAQRPAARDVLVVSHGGQEWGLQGSRLLAAAPPEGRLRAVVNVDIAGHANDPVHVVGRSREQVLARVLDDAFAAAGFAAGPDIGARADRDGADHWPWAARGIPAVSVFQGDHAQVDPATDAPDQVDAATLVRVADAIEAAVRALADAP